MSKSTIAETSLILVRTTGRRDDELISSLIDRARTFDGTRLVSAAMEKTTLPDGTYTVQDELLEKTDSSVCFSSGITLFDI